MKGNYRKEAETSYLIKDEDLQLEVGYLINNRKVYQVYDEYQNKGIATEALCQATKKVSHPVLEIMYNNIPSKKSCS